MKKRIFSEEETNNIIKMYKECIPSNKICEIFHMSKPLFYKFLRANNIEIRGYKILSDKKEKEIVEKYLDGETMMNLAKEYNVSITPILHCLQKHNVILREYNGAPPKYKVNENYFDNIDNQEKAYICGLLWADGCNKRDRDSIAITLQEEDKYIIEQIRECMGSNHPIYFMELSKKNPNWKNAYEFEIRNKHISEQLYNLGMIDNKSLVLDFPNWISDDLLPHFIRGYLDGDGSIHKDGGYVDITSSEKFCRKLEDILLKYGIPSKLYHRNDYKTTNSLRITHKDNIIKFLDWIYFDATIYLYRKYERYQKLKNKWSYLI